jgi:hypothetical protein
MLPENCPVHFIVIPQTWSKPFLKQTRHKTLLGLDVCWYVTKQLAFMLGVYWSNISYSNASISFTLFYRYVQNARKKRDKLLKISSITP